ncbi:hypothetical protein Micbo1qcDRAFT_33817 [Microdochium bolleyi]|uniref:Uncharacterized protein n=1 Tax=Microdochium bolleyi TaxID=196109 RepID=A0A136IP13_9PEZI|nr:hypothetical protein Micbo1qcDRAFT_33817 [Microdochium bolleyi]
MNPRPGLTVVGVLTYNSLFSLTRSGDDGQRPLGAAHGVIVPCDLTIQPGHHRTPWHTSTAATHISLCARMIAPLRQCAVLWLRSTRGSCPSEVVRCRLVFYKSGAHWAC